MSDQTHSEPEADEAETDDEAGLNLPVETWATESEQQTIPEQPTLLTSVLDPDGRLRAGNETAMKQVEPSQASVTGEPIWEAPWWDETSRSQIRQWVRRAASGETVEFETETSQPDGTPQRVVGVIRPLTNGLGEIESLVASVRMVEDSSHHQLDRPTTPAQH